FGEHWEGGLFAGGYPNPYSRSLLTDYAPPCGDGVASGNSQIPLAQLQMMNPLELGFPRPADVVNVAPDPCQAARPQLALAAGLTARYRYDRVWGNMGLVGSFFAGDNDGGPVRRNDGVTNLVSNVQQPITERDRPRIYLNWTNHANPVDRFDLFS